MNKFHNHKELKIFGEVWLHGSRGMNNRLFPWEAMELPKGTDWDYAARHRQPWPQMGQVAYENGWTEVVDKAYMDNNTTFVYEKTIDGEKVQVSLRQCLPTYKACFNSVNPNFYFTYLWKGSDKCFPIEDRRKFWNSLYRTYSKGVSSLPQEWEIPF